MHQFHKIQSHFQATTDQAGIITDGAEDGVTEGVGAGEAADGEATGNHTIGTKL